MSTNYASYQQRRSEDVFDIDRLMRKQRRKDYAITFTIIIAAFALGSRFGSSKK
jgi:hypothetical protein